MYAEELITGKVKGILSERWLWRVFDEGDPFLVLFQKGMPWE